MSGRAAALLEAEGVAMTRGARCVLDRICVAFHAGEWTAIVGPNGAGKSTLLALLAGLLRPSAGAIRLQGRLIHQWSDRERALRLTWFGQTGVPDGDIAANEVVRLGRLPRFGLFGSPTAADEGAVRRALEETEAAPFAQRRLGELSAGERQRVLLSRAFAADAPVSLFDEPTIHLDAPHQRRLVRSLLTRARGGAAVVSVLHDVTLALAADRMVVLAAGRVCADGPPADAGVRDALTAVFEHAFTIEAFAGARWAAVPIL